jgi:hypothetical protein
MATRFSNSLHGDASLASNIQSWAQFIEDTLVSTGGWSVTTDTGQTLPSALTAATAVNQKKGYRIYKMGDALQATAPVYMKLEFGSGGGNPPGGAIAAGVWPTIGMGSDGAGNITNILWNGGALTVAPICGNNGANNGQATLTNSYGSAASGRFSLGMFVSTVLSELAMVFTLERSKNEFGEDTDDGLLLLSSNVAFVGGGGVQASVSESRYMIYRYDTQPSGEIGLSYALTVKNPSDAYGAVGVAVPIHFKGIAQQPGENAVIANGSDITAESSFQIPIYGHTRTYKHLNVVTAHKSRTGVGSAIADSAVRFCMRYD